MKKIAVVTGGTRGIGASISKALHEHGYDVIANYFINDEAAKEFSEINQIKVMKWNVSDYNECEEAVKNIEQTYNDTVSVLINNAGITRDVMLHKMTEKEWWHVHIWPRMVALGLGNFKAVKNLSIALWR